VIASPFRSSVEIEVLQTRGRVTEPQWIDPRREYLKPGCASATAQVAWSETETSFCLGRPSITFKPAIPAVATHRPMTHENVRTVQARHVDTREPRAESSAIFGTRRFLANASR